MQPTCRHCHRHRANRPRRLCWSCYYWPGVRDLYPPTGKYNRRGVGLAVRYDVPLPEETTDAAPGSAEKLRVLEERAARQVSLFHPLDRFRAA